jgi:hypothetical protein
MEKVVVNKKEYDLEAKDAALVEAIQDLTDQLRRFANNG